MNSLFVPALQAALKHPTVFKQFDELQSGESFLLINDHDPKPLYYQLMSERGNVFSWQYVEEGPQWWRVQIKKNNVAGETVGEMAAKDLRKAEVFKKFGIDFCCGGKKTLKQACEEKGLDLVLLEEALNNTTNTAGPAMDFNRWQPDFLVDYIFNQHHQYYYNEAPVISDLLSKVLSRHGNQHPELQEINSLFIQLTGELNVHFLKEEKIVFPFIKALMQGNSTGDLSVLNAHASLKAPIQIMESDHEAAGEVLAEIQKITTNYTPPADACNSFQFLYFKLKELDEDLHQHIHLENNILFPKTLALEKQLRK